MSTSLQKGIEAAKSGMMEEALAHLKDAIVEEPENANVWVWLSAIIEDEEKQTIFLKKALEIDPGNRPAQRGLAFIQRKKYIPPKPGEKLSDYTRPIGLFKTPVSPSQAAANVSAALNQEASLNQQAPVAAAPTSQAEVAPSTPARPTPSTTTTGTQRKPWLDIAFYGLTLTVFIVIGILIGTTLLKTDLPFLHKPTPVLSMLPPSEGVFTLEDGVYQEMKLSLNEPSKSEGIPAVQTQKPTVVINTLLITMEKVKFVDEKNAPVTFTTQPAENQITLLTPEQELTKGRYCLIYTLNEDKQEALYWCLNVN